MQKRALDRRVDQYKRKRTGASAATFLRVLQSRSLLALCRTFPRIMIVVGLLAAVSSCQQQKRREGDADFKGARQLAVDGNYAAAGKAFQKYVDEKPQGRDASRAGLFLFKVHFSEGNFKEAASWCEWTMRNHPASLEAHKCRYKLALISLVQGDTQDAIARFGTLADQPDGPLAAEATAMRRFLQSVEIVPDEDALPPDEPPAGRAQQ